jgi:hypothetical protein
MTCGFYDDDDFFHPFDNACIQFHRSYCKMVWSWVVWIWVVWSWVVVPRKDVSHAMHLATQLFHVHIADQM